MRMHNGYIPCPDIESIRKNQNIQCQLYRYLGGFPFVSTNGYIRDETSGVESYPYPVKEGQRLY